MLKPGTVLGAFRIIAPLGAGGMGEVWRALDSKLQREVAIKVLPDDFATDPERLSRFQREAQTLASLNHPNIAAVYDLQQEGPTRCIVLELVEGETLAQRIGHGAIPLEDALPIAKQIADALEAAHEKGIVHRDLKPANIKITPEGKVKVLDFGLAKMAEAQPGEANLSHSPTLVSRTVGGVILGTPGYLSPEQARGKPVDKRSDIWAFGCVLYEMLTGKQAFNGETLSDIVAAILSRDVDWQTLPNVPEKIRELLVRCLQKDPTRRLRDIGDARIAIDELITSQTVFPVETKDVVKRRTHPVLWIAAIVAAFALGLGIMWLRPSSGDSRPTFSGVMLGGPEVAILPRVSPDGRLVAFQAMVDGQTQVAVMQPESGDWTVLTRDRTRGLVSSLSWSPDGTRIYYGRVDGVPRGVFSVPAVGGEERLVLEDASCPETLSDGSILVVRYNEQRRPQIHRFWPETGRLQSYPATIAGIDLFRFILAFPDAKEAVFWGMSADQPESDPNMYFYNLNLDSTTVKRIPGLMGTPFDQIRALAATADGKNIVITDRSGDLTSIIEIPRNGGPARELLSLSQNVWGLDVAANGDLYVGQMSRPFEFVQMEADGSRQQTLLTGNMEFSWTWTPLNDGRLVFPVRIGGRNRLLVSKPSQNPSPFVQTSEESTGPVTMVGTSEVGFVLGTGSMRKLAIASLADGRIVRRLEKADGPGIQALAATADGQTLYYAAGGKIWSIPSHDGSPKMIHEGDSVAVDPNGQYLIIQLNENNNVRLVRVPLNGGAEQPLSFPDVRFTFLPLSPNAIRADGAILKQASYSDAWQWALALLNPNTGKAQRITLPLLDVQQAGWTATGQIVALSARTSSSIWRMRPKSGT